MKNVYLGITKYAWHRAKIIHLFLYEPSQTLIHILHYGKQIE